MSDLLNAAKKRLQEAFQRLEKVVELHEDERTKMRQKIVELEAVVHHMQTENNMLMRLQEQLANSQAAPVGAEQESKAAISAAKPVTAARRTTKKADRPLNIEGLEDEVAHDPAPAPVKASKSTAKAAKTADAAATAEPDNDDMADMSGIKAAALSIRDFKAMAQRVNENS